MKILIINEGLSDNLGDQAINDSLFYLARLNGVDDITHADFTKNISIPNEISIHNVKRGKLIFIKKLLPVKLYWFLKNFSRINQISKGKYDKVIIGGGQLLLSNNYFSVALFTWITFLKFYHNHKIIIFSVGSGSKFRLADKILFKYALKKADSVFVRDFKSQVFSKTFFNIKSNFVYDVAFMHNKFLKIEKRKTDQILLGVVSYDIYVRYNSIFKSKDQYYKSWIKLLDKNKIDIKNVKLFYTTQYDRETSLDFKDYLFKYLNIELSIVETKDKYTLIREINKSQKIISARMHALILALTYKTEIIPYNISDKISSLSEMVKYNFDLENIQNDIKIKFKKALNEEI